MMQNIWIKTQKEIKKGRLTIFHITKEDGHLFDLFSSKIQLKYNMLEKSKLIMKSFIAQNYFHHLIVFKEFLCKFDEFFIDPSFWK